jgi:NAD+ synthase
MRKISCPQETERIAGFIKSTFKAKHHTRAVIGVSGGLDSAVCTALLVEALGARNVFGILLPYQEQLDSADAEQVCKKFKINSIRLPITEQVNAFLQKSPATYKAEPLRKGNICARVRMIELFDLSADLRALVCGTSNKTELMTGYFTLHGDGACALEPIGHLFKTEVRQLAAYLGVPQRIITKAPSAGLWENQTDEAELGATYEEIDEILYILSKYPEAIQDFSRSHIVDDKMKAILKRVAANSFKLELPAMLEDVSYDNL